MREIIEILELLKKSQDVMEFLRTNLQVAKFNGNKETVQEISTAIKILGKWQDDTSKTLITSVLTQL